MSILAELARAERIRAKAFREVALHRTQYGDVGIVLDAMAFMSERAADMMEAEVKAEFAREIADGAV